MTEGVHCMILRGGSSKGAYFLRDDLPHDHDERDAMLRRLLGSPDPRQIDGIGGAHPLTSKVAIVARATDAAADVDYLFLQVGVEEEIVSDRQNCGNLLAAVGPFALERGVVAAEPGTEMTMRIRMVNTDSVATARFPVDDTGAPVYHGDTAISGVPGTAAPIRLEFEDLAGGTTGALLPTGNVADTIDGIDCTLIDNGMPVVVLAADDLGVDGHESCPELEADTALRAALESIRLQAGPLMGLGDVAATTIPKLTMVAPPSNGGHLATRTFIPHRCHEAIGVLGAVSVATAARLPGSPANAIVDTNARSPAADVGGRAGGVLRLEHPTGFFDAVVEVIDHGGRIEVPRAGIVRTARKLMDGLVFPRPADQDGAR